jgi:hypothetical protein
MEHRPGALAPGGADDGGTMSMADLLARVSAAFEAAAKTPFENVHGLTGANVNRFRVDPYQISATDDDGITCTVWVVLEEIKGLHSGYGIAFDPLTEAWFVVERVQSPGTSAQFAVVIQADSLVGALEGM